MTVTAEQVSAVLDEVFADRGVKNRRAMARRLHEQGLVRKQIAHELGISYSMACKALPASCRRISQHNGGKA